MEIAIMNAVTLFGRFTVKELRKLLDCKCNIVVIGGMDISTQNNYKED